LIDDASDSTRSSLALYDASRHIPKDATQRHLFWDQILRLFGKPRDVNSNRAELTTASLSFKTLTTSRK
jgi:hypothetical protein